MSAQPAGAAAADAHAALGYRDYEPADRKGRMVRELD